ncbi:MAG: hypothetical protein M3Y68_11600, partial [Chloroflexota bacterium]|nr:hypothetical protein [Chloroflexota bacterium]
MSATEISPQGPDTKLVPIRNDEGSRKARITSMARASTDFYGAIGWFAGLILTLLVSLPIIWFMTQNASRGNRDEVLALGLAIAWWFNPLSMGALGYVLSNVRAWRLWTAIGLVVWLVVNVLVSAALVSTNARIMIFNGLIVLGYILLGLFFLYLHLRVFLWAASGKPAKFFFGIMLWAAFNGLIYWAIISPEVLNIILVVLSFALRIVFAISFVVIQFVAIFWFMAQSRVEVIRPGDPKQVTFDDYKGQPNLIK